MKPFPLPQYARAVLMTIAAMNLVGLVAQSTKPELKNVTAAQRPDSYLVDITYDLVAPEGVQAIVTVEASADNGARYDVPSISLSGDFGLLKPGEKKHIVWNAWNDWPGHKTDVARVRLTADGMVLSTIPAPTTNLVWIPPGTFMMGSPDDEKDRGPFEGPRTQVWISRGFWMGKYEATRGEYIQLMGALPGDGADRIPATAMTRGDAMEFCRLLTDRERNAGRVPAGYAYRLPTEAEWEYACRAGTTTRFYFGDDPGYVAVRAAGWVGLNAQSRLHIVGEKVPNRWGLYDMCGNAGEMCLDDWNYSLQGGAVSDPRSPAGYAAVYRGGSIAGPTIDTRSAARAQTGFGDRDGNVGFRVVLAPN